MVRNIRYQTNNIIIIIALVTDFDRLPDFQSYSGWRWEVKNRSKFSLIFVAISLIAKVWFFFWGGGGKKTKNFFTVNLISSFLADRTIGRAFVTACRLSVCLSVCRLWRFVSRQNGWTDLHEIFREGVKWPRDDLVTFYVNSEKPRDAAILISLSATLRENGWTDLHECTTAFA